MFASAVSGISPVLGFGFEFSPWQLMLILVIVLLLFGGRVPEVMRNLGRGVSEFKKGMRTLEEDLNAPQGQQTNQPYQGQAQNQYQPQLPQQPVYRAPTDPAGQDPRVAQSGYGQQAPAGSPAYPGQPMQQPYQGGHDPYPQQPVPPPQQH